MYQLIGYLTQLKMSLGHWAGKHFYLWCLRPDHNEICQGDGPFHENYFRPVTLATVAMVIK